MIKAIIFDLFGVVISDDFWQKLLNSTENTEKRKYLEGLSNSTNLGDITWEDFTKTVAKESNISNKEVIDAYNNLKINRVLIDYILSNKDKYKVCLLTNVHSGFTDNFFKQNNLRDLFDYIVVSSDLRLIKPSAEIFEYTINKLGLKPGECVFIDDRQDNIDGAMASGIKSIKFVNNKQLIYDLRTVLKND